MARQKNLNHVPRQDRNRLLEGLEVYDYDNGELLGYLVEISHQGMQLNSRRAMIPARRYRMRIKLPPDHFPSPELHCTAVTRWSQPAGSEGFQAGFALAESSTEILDTICKLINMFGFQERETRFLATLQEFDRRC
ncbi:PilZ domain-containing protein [Desulfurivibrio alkaliphilus]|nr:PilZ domain-containing protein [Desulfurivibrio alkaliphilus]